MAVSLPQDAPVPNSLPQAKESMNQEIYGTLTPPGSDDGLVTPTPEDLSVLTALHVMSTERLALQNLEILYQTNKLCRNRLASAISAISNTTRIGGKVVICGIGKSGKIGQKLVATLNSLGITSVFLHAAEALHGDLGIIKDHDTILMITFSGTTPELAHLLPHLPSSPTLIVMTSHIESSTCPLLCTRPDSILVSAPIHESETASFGFSAPTSSTTVALALGDSIALAVAQAVHNSPGKSPAEVFRVFHPGGAIGIANGQQKNS